MQPQLRFDMSLVSAGPTLFAFVHILLSGIHTLATSADYVTQIYLFVNDTSPDKRRWAVLSEVQPLDKYICKSVSQVVLFAYSSICETLHTNIPVVL